jgi:hypothetical protein
MILRINSDYFLNSIKQLVFVMEMGNFLRGRDWILNVFKMNFGFKGLTL